MESQPTLPLELRPKVQFFRGLNRMICSMYHRVDVQSAARLPKAGPAILVCNHTSGLDPLLLQSTANRVIVWMMAAEYYEIKPLKPFFQTIEAIPVNRNGRDSAATRAALRALDAGNVLGIFPEGKIAKTREMLPFQTGVAMMAIKTGVPVYPAYLDGNQRGKDMIGAFASSRSAILRFGDEVKIPREDTSRETLEAATKAIQDAVQALQDM